MAKKIKHEEFIEKMRIKRPNIEVLGKYKNSRTKIICICCIDYEIWEAVPYELLKYGCPVCSGSRRNHYSFIKELNKVNPNIEVLGRYKGIHDNIKCKCKVCGHIWYPEPNGLLSRGNGCPQCVIINRTMTHEEFIERMNKINPNIKILSKYQKSDIKVDCLCLIDGNKWSAKPNDLLSNKGCMECAIRNNTGENSPRWNSNITQEERERGRKYTEYYEWRNQVYKRDNYTCQCCGSNQGGNLNAHHLYSYDKYKCLRTVVENGVTLCEDCHKEFHSIYGYGENTLEQYNEFINNKDNEKVS